MRKRNDVEAKRTNKDVKGKRYEKRTERVYEGGIHEKQQTRKEGQKDSKEWEEETKRK